jgi:hypothetical protein
MNVPLVLKLSLLGLIVGACSVTGIVRSGSEGYAWLVVAVVSALVIGRAAVTRRFLTGFVAGFLACVLSVLVQVAFFDRYLHFNPEAVNSFRSMPADVPPRILVLLLMPIVAAFNGCVVGFLSWVAARVLSRKPAAAS